LSKISNQPAANAGTRELLQAQAAILKDPRMQRSWGQLPFKPVLDGELLNASPVEALRAGSHTEVALLLGNNLDEWNLFSAADPASFTLDDSQIRERLQWLLPLPLLNPLLEHYHLRAESLPTNPWPLWSRAWNLLLTDMVFTLPGLRLLQAHSGKCFHYHFAQPLAAQPLLGACHAVELGYVFGTHGESSLQNLYAGESNAHQLSQSMREAWLNFAEHGDPGDDWPAFSNGHSRRFGEHPEARPFDAAQVSSLWQHISDDLLHGYL
jgi:para-nitrobenzyl esterase